MIKLTDLYAVAGISKQSAYKYRKQQKASAGQQKRVLAAMDMMRKDHRKMSSRKIYTSKKELFEIEVGRDKFEQIAFANGYRVRYRKQTHKTTWGQRVEVYPDLVSGLAINNINMINRMIRFVI